MSDTSGLLIRFATMREKHEARSLVAGHDVFEEVEVVFIRILGSKDEVANLVTDEHRQIYADQYKAWKAGQAAPVSGMPLEEWTAASQSFIDDMRSYGVRTVEQLAALSDGVVGSRPGWMTMRSKAAAYLEQAQVDGALAAEQAKTKLLEDQLAALQAQIDTLTAPPGPAKK